MANWIVLYDRRTNVVDDPLEVVDARMHRTDCLKNLLAGRSAFLICGGPSAKPHLDRLNRRGVFSLAVNNSAGSIARPQAFVFSDPPLKFSHSIWQDPAVMKFCPTPKMRSSRNMLREKVDGVFYKSSLTVVDCPNVWGFRRESLLRPDDSFFTLPGACWGNLDSGIKITGEQKTVCTMLLGIRLLVYLGAQRIHMLGVDFRMTPESGYSFAQARTQNACISNNRQFGIVNEWLCKMQSDGVFERRGVSLFNCYQHSGLRAFPYVPFEQALEDVVGQVEEFPDLGGWYEKSRCKCGSWNIKHQDGVFTCVSCGKGFEEEPTE